MENEEDHGNVFAIPNLWTESSLGIITLKFQESPNLQPQIWPEQLDLWQTAAEARTDFVLKPLDTQLPEREKYLHVPLDELESLETSSVSFSGTSVELFRSAEDVIW